MLGPRRYRVLPDHGVLLVVPDLHGNLQDLQRAEQVFAETEARDPETHLLFLGDLVHGPDEQAGRAFPALYDYPDRSWEVISAVLELRRRCPGRVHLLLGNHDWGHVGGPHTSRFHGDEVAHLEHGLDSAQLAALRGLFEQALLLVAAPCGVVLTHGCPDDSLQSLAQLDRLNLLPAANSGQDAALLRGLMTNYGQPEQTTARLLATAGRLLRLDLRLAVYGHERDEEGWFSEAPNQLCPVIFGAPQREKRLLRLDLTTRYGGAADLHDGEEIVRLY